MSFKTQEKEYLGKPDIKLNIDIDESDLDYDYSYSENVTDDDIYYYWAVKDLFGWTQAPQVTKAGTKEITPEDRDKIIEYGRKKMRPILPDSLEFIPRKYWLTTGDYKKTPFEAMIGENLRLIHHPLYWLTQRIIRENYQPTCDTLLIQACSNMKPYIDNRNYSVTKQLFKEGYCDIVVNSCELTPLEFTIFYPFRHYDWSHLRETPFITDCLERNNFHSIISFINTFKYKKVLVLGPTFPNMSGYSYLRLIDMLKETYTGTGVEIINVMDEPTLQKNVETLGGNGFAKSRYQISHATRERLYSLLNYNGPKRSDYNYGITIKCDEEKKKKLQLYFNKDVVDFDNYVEPKRKKKKEIDQISLW